MIDPQISKSSTRIELVEERQCLGGLILAPETLAEAQTFLRSRHFIDVRHRAIYEALLRLQGTMSNGDLPLIWRSISEAGEENRVSVDYLASIVENCVCAANAVEHGKKVLRYAKMRAIKSITWRIDEEIEDVHDLTDDALARWVGSLVSTLTDCTSENRVVAFAEDLKTLNLNPECDFESDRPLVGLIDLDNEPHTLFSRGALTVIAARPGMGKSTFMRHLLRTNARAHSALVFSMEESRESLRDKIVCAETGLALWKFLRRKTLSDVDRTNVCLAMGRVSDLKLHVCDATLTADEVAAYARRQHYMGNSPRMIYVDHLQHMRHERLRGESDHSMVARAVLTLCNLAKELNCSVVLFAQLNREVEHRDPPRPMLSDLRETGKLEEVAANVIFLWSEQTKNQDRYVYVAKQRNGQLLEAKVRFDGELGRFQNLMEVGNAPGDRKRGDWDT